MVCVWGQENLSNLVELVQQNVWNNGIKCSFLIWLKIHLCYQLMNSLNTAFFRLCVKYVVMFVFVFKRHLSTSENFTSIFFNLGCCYIEQLSCVIWKAWQIQRSWTTMQAGAWNQRKGMLLKYYIVSNWNRIYVLTVL